MPTRWRWRSLDDRRLRQNGLELQVTQLYGCDYDPADPCWAGTFRAKGRFAGRTAEIEWKTRSTRILGHVVEIVGQDEIVVRRLAPQPP